MSANKQSGNIKGAGRPAGSPNKSTSLAREAIALESVAEGIQDEETGKWLVPPNPEKAFAMLQSVVEYHVPKLARQELVGDDKAPVKIQVSWKKS